MPDPVTQTHPRKLYTQLLECTSADGRARAALEFVRGSTGSDGGFLFLARGEHLALAASSNDAQPLPELIVEANRSWDHELDRHADEGKSVTLELSMIEALRQAQESPLWRDSQRMSFERRLLSVYRGPNWLPVGLVMLRAREGRALVPIRQVHIEALCNALVDAGDVPERNSLTPEQRG